MALGSPSQTILVVDDDEVLSSVLGRVLASEGRTIIQAGSAGQALEMAYEHAPGLALLDLSLPDGNGVELAESLKELDPNLPLILLTAFPQRLEENPEKIARFTRVLTKPPNLFELRETVDEALHAAGARTAALSRKSEEVNSAIAPQGQYAEPPGPARKVKEIRMPVTLGKGLKSAGIVVLVLVVLAGIAMATGRVRIPWSTSPEAEQTPPPQTGPQVELVKGMSHTLSVPEEVRDALGMRKDKVDIIAIAKTPAHSEPLVLPGSTALDPTRIMRIRARFAPAEVVEIHQVHDYSAGRTVFRELRSGDTVAKGDVMAVFYSVDVGNKKNDLVDGIVQLRLDEEVLKRAESGAGAVPEVFILNARRNVQADQNAITRAVNTLKTWNIPDEDVQAVRDEAEQIAKRHGKRDKTKEKEWARVELKAPDDGTVIERNVSLHETVVDNTINLFQVAKIDRLTVMANAPEDDLPILQALTPAQSFWTVRTVGSPPVKGAIDDIGYIIDPNQHTALVKGHIENPNGHLRAGQFVSATVDIPPPPGVVEVPMSAIVDDGKQCVVFVQPDEKKPVYTLRRVKVTHRFDTMAFVRSHLTDAEKQLSAQEKEQGLEPLQPLRKGERIITAGVMELKAALEDLESKSPPTP